MLEEEEHEWKNQANLTCKLHTMQDQVDVGSRVLEAVLELIHSYQCFWSSGLSIWKALDKASSKELNLLRLFTLRNHCDRKATQKLYWKTPIADKLL